MGKYGVSTYGISVGITAAELKNLALFTIGFTDKIDFSDAENGTAQKVNRVYSESLFYVLSSYPWRFILRRKHLAERLDADENSKYKYNYVSPENMLTMRNLYRDSDYSRPVTEFEVCPRHINTSADDVYIWYSAIVEEEDFPQYFVDYFKYKLAFDLCFNMTGDTNLLQILKVQSDQMLASAKNIDAKQTPVRQIRSSPFLAIRR
jgi:hypothetical protein